MVDGPRAPFICPGCRTSLDSVDYELRCTTCGSHYPIRERIADFSGGNYYDSFHGPEELDDIARAGLEAENDGNVRRMSGFYAHFLQALNARTVLDCGAGNGLGVDVLNEAGYDAWGIDLSALRRWQWESRTFREKLVVADAMCLPFPDQYFDVVISSGVIEHIGVHEERSPDYKVSVLPDRDESRRRFLSEILRVSKTAVFVDCPNGSFPVDFWHATRLSRPRFHSPREGFLPTFFTVRRLVRQLDPHARVVALSPYGRLNFKQSSGQWFGRLFHYPALTLFRSMTLSPLRWLAATPLNPYLVLRIDK